MRVHLGVSMGIETFLIAVGIVMLIVVVTTLYVRHHLQSMRDRDRAPLDDW